MKKFFFIGFLILTLACNLPAAQVESTPTAAADLLPTATLTPAPTATPSPTATISPPTPVPLYFTDEFNTDLSAWTSFQTGGAQPPIVALQDDALISQMQSPNTWYYAIHNAHEYTGASISAKVSGAPSGSLGLVCGYSEANGWYEFNITHEGMFSVLQGKWLAEGIADYRPILNSTTEYLQAGNMNYEIGLTCNNNTLFFHVNGKMFRKLDVSYIGLTPGKVGLSAASFDNVPMNANFEWFKVSKPEW